MLRTHNQPCILHKGAGITEGVFLVGERNGVQLWLCWRCLRRILGIIELSPRVIEKVMTKWAR